MTAFLRCLLNRPRWIYVRAEIPGYASVFPVCAWCQAERGSARHP